MDRHQMHHVLKLQPAGAFLHQVHKRATFAPVRYRSEPIAVVGSCMDFDRPECDEEDAMTRHLAACQMRQEESWDFLTSIRRGLDELMADTSDDESDDEGEYYQVSQENTYYRPDHKTSCDLLLDDALDLSDTSTASSSLFISWAQQDSDEEEEDMSELMFQLEL